MAAAEKKRILPLRSTGEGWDVLTVRYTAVPGYDFEATTAGMGDEEIRREVLLDWLAISGVRVYREFNPDIHVAKEPIPYDPTQPLYCCWDFGLTPAFAVTQVNSYGQWLGLSAIAPSEGSGIATYEFGEMAADHLNLDYALPHGRELDQLKLVHFGDPAGQMPPSRSRVNAFQKEVSSHFDIIRDGIEVFVGNDTRGEPIYERKPGWGWRILPGEMLIVKRIEALKARLRLLVHGGLPAFLVSPSCPEMIQALSSYHYKIRADQRQELDPFKGWESHLVNALEYGCTKLWRQPEPDEDESPKKRQRYRSQSAGPERGI